MSKSKYIFKPIHNYWFSYLTSVTTLFILSSIIAVNYIQLSGTSVQYGVYTYVIYTYLEYAGFALLLAIFLSAFFLSETITRKPFIISILLMLLCILSFMLSRWNLTYDPITRLFLKMMVNLFILCLVWWLSRHTKPSYFSYSYTKNKHFRIFAWIGFLLIFSQIAFGDWLRVHHQEDICYHFPFCPTKLLPMYDLPYLINFWSTYSAFIDSQTQLQMMHRAFIVFNLLYIGILSLFLIRRENLKGIAVTYLTLITVKMILIFFTFAFLSPLTLSVIHYALGLLLLLTTMSLISQLYLKFQVNW